MTLKLNFKFLQKIESECWIWMLAKAIVTKILCVNNHITEKQKYNV